MKFYFDFARSYINSNNYYCIFKFNICVKYGLGKMLCISLMSKEALCSLAKTR